MISILVGYVIDGKSNGIDKYLVHMLELLKENGEEFKIQFLTNHTTQELEKIYGAYKADVIEEPSLKHPIKQCQFLKELIKNQRYDIAYFNISEAFNAMGILAAHKAGVKKIIVHAHSSKVDSAKPMARFFRMALHEVFRPVIGRAATDYVIYGGISILAASASNVFNFFHAHKYVSIKPVGSYNFRQHLKPIVIFFAMSCAATIYTNLDTVMLGFMTSDAEVGYYNAAVKIKSILVSVVTSLGVVLLPRASYYVEHKLMDEFYRITQKAINFVFLIAVPLTVYFILFAKEGIFFLSGSEYASSILPMQVIMPTVFFIGLTNIMGIQMLIPLGKEKMVLYSEIAGAIVDLILNTLLIPIMASTGAAIGTVVAEGVVFLVQFFVLRKEVFPAYRKVRYGTIVLAILVAVVSSLWVKKLAFGNFLTLLISSVICFLAYAVILFLCKEPLVREIWRKVSAKAFSQQKGRGNA